MIGRALGLALASSVVACGQGSAPAPKRFTIEVVAPREIKIVAGPNQHPRCAAFTASDRGVVRLLTAPADGNAMACPAGEAIGGGTFRVPLEDGHARVIVVFASQAAPLAPLAAQVRDVAVRGGVVSGMDLRAPGSVSVETIELPF